MPPKASKANANAGPRTPNRSRTTKTPKTPNSEDDMPKAAKAATKSKVRGEGKRKKDPNAPKRGLSAYMFYANDNRERVRTDNPNVTFGQVGKILGEEWKNLTDEKKAKYQKMAEDDKARYEREKAKYNADDGEEDEGSD